MITYHLPVAGNLDLLQVRPNPFAMRTHTVYVTDGCICFDLVDFYGEPERIKTEIEQVVTLIRTQLQNLTTNVSAFNAKLGDSVAQIVRDRVAQLKAQRKAVESLGVPVRPSNTVPSTFRVPVARKQVIVKPVATPRTSEPVLEHSVYEQILTILQDTGRGMERLPST